MAKVGKQAAIISVGLALGLGGAFAYRRVGQPPAPKPVPSVKEFSFGVTPPTDTSPALLDFGPAPAPTQEPVDGRAAITVFLQGLADGKPDRAYPLLDAASRVRFPTLATWIGAQADRISPLTFELGATGAPSSGAPATGAIGANTTSSAAVVEVAVNATHRPSLDAFRGLVPGRSQSQWRAVQESGGWRVAADPVSFQPVLPSETTAPGVVSAWLAKLIACDTAGAVTYQFDAHLYGPPSLLRAPCDARGEWTAGAAVGLDRTPDPRAFLAAFGSDVGSWARLVPVQGPGRRFLAAVAPMGETWQVIGVAVS